MSSSIKDRILIMLELEQLTDCEFIFPEEEDPEKGIIKAHKLILAFASPVFHSMFFTFGNERDNKIEIPDCSAESFALFLKYVYLHELTLVSIYDATEVYKIAHKYEVLSLQKLCEEYIVEAMTPNEACSAMRFAKFIENEEIKKKSEQMIVENTVEVLNSQDFLETNVETVEFIVKCEKLKVEEIILFEAVEKYARSHKLARHQMENVVQNIRFLTMSKKEFNDRAMRSNLLTYMEKLAILNNILSEYLPTYAYPEGLCQSKVKRFNEKLIKK
ncbi:BTB/POZ domain-containing protein 6-like [Culicoides brevitarsis]|uniref:BTB/POZ domain-containing protein 6-like n=1 Tax=Culicoides brevitarsis TaxID=469753 RepID=UPI00307BBC8C